MIELDKQLVLGLFEALTLLYAYAKCRKTYMVLKYRFPDFAWA